MIKTVSFAPPRSAKVRPSNPSASTPKTSKRAASGSPAQQSLDFLSDAPAEVAPMKAAPAKGAAKAAPVESKPTKAKAPEVKPEVVKARVAKAVALKKVEEVKPKDAKTKVASSKPAIPLEAPTAIEAAPAPTAPPATAKTKARKPRVPVDLAAQYGEKVIERVDVTSILDDKAPKKRLSKDERAARRELIKPDEGLLARLARTTQIVLKKPKAEPRGKGWKFECGRCGQTSFFQTPGGVCPCGTIAVKELV